MEDKNKQYQTSNFNPVFIVGPQRAGTTMLAAMLDRHSRISIPPETLFFHSFIIYYEDNKSTDSREEMVRLALAYRRIADLQLREDEVLEHFSQYEKNLKNLFRSILETYTKKQGKIRAGEKTPAHLLYVPQLLKLYPEAKVVCIIRDGRDAVRSLLRTHWAQPNNPRRFGLLCCQWNDWVQLALNYSKKFSSQQYILVKYEDIVRDPENQLRQICDFVDENFEPMQLNPSLKSATIPERETEWKGKANAGIDRSRLQAWRREAPQQQLWEMNCRMKKALKNAGYNDIELKGCPLQQKILLHIKKVPYYKWVRPISILCLRLLRFFLLQKTTRVQNKN